MVENDEGKAGAGGGGSGGVYSGRGGLKAMIEFLLRAYSVCNLNLIADGVPGMSARELKLYAAFNAPFVLEALRGNEGEANVREAFRVYCAKAENKRRLPSGAELAALIEESRPRVSVIDDPGPRDMKAAQFGAHLVQCFHRRMSLEEAKAEYRKSREEK